MITKATNLITEIFLRYVFFCYFYLKVFKSFKKAEKRNISKEEINKVLSENFHNYQLTETKKIISPIWMRILKKHKVNTLLNIERKNLNSLQNTYQEFISSELCLGVEDQIDKKISFSNLKYSFRFSKQFFNYSQSKSLYPPFLIYQPNRNFLKIIKNFKNSVGSIFSKDLENSQSKYFNNYKVFGSHFPSDYFDHIYFIEFINGIIFDKKEKFIEIGGGSALLSILMHKFGYKNSLHIDIAPYLLAQNLFLNNKKSDFYLSERINVDDILNADFLVNQDSFPEIPNGELKKLFNLVENNNINKIFSNNHCSNNENQSDFRFLLQERNYIPIIKFPNPIRKGYLIEYYVKR